MVILSFTSVCQLVSSCAELYLSFPSLRLSLCVCVSRRVLVLGVVLGLLVLVMVYLPVMETGTNKPLDWHVNPAHKKVRVR